MTLTLDLSPDHERELTANAKREGVPVAEYVLRHVLPSYARRVKKPYRALQFSGSAPRPVEEIEAHIADVEASRNEWDERDWRQMGFPG